MTFSRRMFLRAGVLTAASFASLPLDSLAAGRVLPGETALPGKGQAAAGNRLSAPPTKPEPPQAIYGALAQMSRESFQQAIGSAFHVGGTSGNQGPFWLRLLSVKDLPVPATMDPASMAVPPPPAALNAPQTTGFSLAFSGGPLTNVAQGSYIFRHAELGEFALFIVPSGPQQYTAVINTLVFRKALPV